MRLYSHGVYYVPPTVQLFTSKKTPIKNLNFIWRRARAQSLKGAVGLKEGIIADGLLAASTRDQERRGQGYKVHVR